MSRAELKLVASRGIAQAISPPVCVTPPTIEASDFRVGVPMTGLPGTWVGAEVLSYQWLMDDTPVLGATNTVYTPTAEDEGKAPSFRVEGANASPHSPTVAISEAGDAIAEEIPQDPVLPVSQTVRFMPKTRAGHGGHKCGYGGTGYLKVTGAAATYVRIDDLNQLVPVGTFGAVAPAWAAGSTYSGTLVEYADAGLTNPTGRTGALSVSVASQNGYTITWRPAPAANNDEANSQLRTVLNGDASLGYVIEVRDGAVLNPTGADWRLRTTYTAAQTAARAAAFTGENHVVIRPETPLAATLRCIKLEGQKLHRVDYLRFQYFTGQLTSAAVQPIASTTAVFMETAGADHIDIWDCDISSTPNSEYGGDQFSGIYTTYTARRWRVRRNRVHDVMGGIYLLNSPTKFDFGTAWTALPTDQNDHHDSADCFHEVSFNEVYRVSNDEINISNSTGPLVYGNVLYDKVTGVRPWDALTAQQKLTGNSPYDTNVQPHGDSLSFDWSKCLFGSVDGPKVWNNCMSRGLGRDTMPFYTSPPYPNPDSKGYVPAANKVYNSSQGVWFANNDNEVVARGWDGVRGSGTGYPVILKAPQVINNTYNRDMVNGIAVNYAENPIIENNSIMGCKNVPTANFIAAAGRISCNNISGTQGRIRRNIGNGPSISVSYAAGGSLASYGENIFVSYTATTGDTAYGSVWNDPVDGPSLRHLADWQAHYRAKVGGPADQSSPIGAFKTNGDPVQLYAA
ncbi:hypothetical protein LJR164_001644 [Phenylobacterium sp. LjRoot164]|uniref:hypothetical protein n=1 Tax=unclassified Phenylobacterium TaxID=2640670 RepID=UPI003ED03992